MLRVRARYNLGLIGTEQAVEGELRNDFLENRRMRIAPGKKRSVHTRESAARRVDTAARRVDAELEARQRGFGSDALRRELIDGCAARIQIVARRALHVAAGKPSRYFRPVPVASYRVLV